MKNLFEYTDYRLFLHEHYEETRLKKPYYSYRFIAGKVGINAGFIFRLFTGKTHLGLKKIDAFADLCGLEGKNRAYFSEMVRLGRAKREQDIQQSLKRLQSIKGVQFTTLAEDQISFFNSWHTMPMRSLLSIYPFNGKNYRRLGGMMVPPLTAAEAKKSIQLLERLGLIRRNAEGIFEVTDTFVSTSEKWSSLAIHQYQKTTIELSHHALDKVPKDKRDISTVTFTCSTRHLPALRERLQEIRDEMVMLSKEFRDEDCVMQLNLQLFPAAIVAKGEL